ncbi:unnamed protein product [Urochloa decumbens]|uniref:Filament-like plant protein 7 n=1 Tax=Urochloa decumbens TaxID=240449 RepID=A0ABC8ZZJ1_9POAL
MAEMEEALRSCMERLVIDREEREQIIMEAANEISSEKRKARELQQKLEDANKKAAKLAAENNTLRKAADAKDSLIGELRGSEASAAGKLADATASLEAARKQAGTLQYEVRMLQKELEVRGQERDYDLRSADAARRREAEHLARIAQLEAECHRLRAMVRKRLPGPAAIAKMRDEVDHQHQQQSTPTASPRRPRPGTPSSPRPAALAPRTPSPSPSPRRSVSSDAEASRLRAVEEENRALKRELAKREGELQLVEMRYADEACKLAVVQRQLKDLTEENKQLSDANCESQSWASALISELEQFRNAKENGASIMASSSEMNLLDDFAELEKMEMASGDVKGNVPRASSLKKPDTTTPVTLTPEKSGNDPVVNGTTVPNGHPERVHDIWNLVMQKHEASGESIEAILEEIQSAISNNREDSEVSYDLSEIGKAVRDLMEKITSMIGTFAGCNVARSGPLLHGKSELCSRLDHLVQVCHDLLNGKAKLEKFFNEVCLILKYIVGEYISNQNLSHTVDSDEKDFDEDKSPVTLNGEGKHDIQIAEPAATIDIQKESQEGPNQSYEDHTMASHQEKLDEELAQVVLAQGDNILLGRKSADYVIESSAAESSVQHCAAQEECHLATNSEFLAAADKLAECQETITILNKQLQGLKIPRNSSGPLDGSICNPRPSSAKSDYKPQSLASILGDEFANAEGSKSPNITAKQEQFKKDEDATPMMSTAQKQSSAGSDDKDSMQIVVHPVFAPVPRQEDHASADPKRKKRRSQSLLGRIIFRKKVEG